MSADMSSRYTRRLQKELMDIQKNPPPGIAVQEVTSLHKCVFHFISSSFDLIIIQEIFDKILLTKKT